MIAALGCSGIRGLLHEKGWQLQGGHYAPPQSATANVSKHTAKRDGPTAEARYKQQRGRPKQQGTGPRPGIRIGIFVRKPLVESGKFQKFADVFAKIRQEDR